MSFANVVKYFAIRFYYFENYQNASYFTEMPYAVLILVLMAMMPMPQRQTGTQHVSRILDATWQQ